MQRFSNLLFEGHVSQTLLGRFPATGKLVAVTNLTACFATVMSMAFAEAARLVVAVAVHIAGVGAGQPLPCKMALAPAFVVFDMPTVVMTPLPQRHGFVLMPAFHKCLLLIQLNAVQRSNGEPHPSGWTHTGLAQGFALISFQQFFGGRKDREVTFASLDVRG